MIAKRVLMNPRIEECIKLLALVAARNKIEEAKQYGLNFAEWLNHKFEGKKPTDD